jgi:hypothetical protein
VEEFAAVALILTRKSVHLTGQMSIYIACQRDVTKKIKKNPRLR